MSPLERAANLIGDMLACVERLLFPADPAGCDRAEAQRQALVDAEAETEVTEPCRDLFSLSAAHRYTSAPVESSPAVPPAVGDRPTPAAYSDAGVGQPTSAWLEQGAVYAEVLVALIHGSDPPGSVHPYRQDAAHMRDRAAYFAAIND